MHMIIIIMELILPMVLLCSFANCSVSFRCLLWSCCHHRLNCYHRQNGHHCQNCHHHPNCHGCFAHCSVSFWFLLWSLCHHLQNCHCSLANYSVDPVKKRKAKYEDMFMVAQYMFVSSIQFHLVSFKYLVSFPFNFFLYHFVSILGTFGVV